MNQSKIKDFNSVKGKKLEVAKSELGEPLMEWKSQNGNFVVWRDCIQNMCCNIAWKIDEDNVLVSSKQFGLCKTRYESVKKKKHEKKKNKNLEDNKKLKSSKK